ncbi:MAG: sulfatase-like hydrolase/transferase [Bradymonadaceae bacterium]
MMHPHRIPSTLWALMVCGLLLMACEKSATAPTVPPPIVTQIQPGESAEPVHAETPHAEPEVEPEPAVILAASPRMDLIDNRYRWHLYRRGLVIPFASEGIRKYGQEYSRPFGKVIEHDGRPGRVLERSSALLRVPWEDDGAVTARVFMHGATRGQRVQLNVNGRRAGVVPVGPEWGHVDIQIPEGLLRTGENELRLTLSSRATVAGERTYGLFHAIELAPEFEEDPVWPQLSPVVAGEEGELAMGGFGRLAIYLEIPEDAWLSLRAIEKREGATARVMIRTIGGQVIELSGDDLIDLAAFANQLVVLELHGEDIIWGEPRIGLAEAKVLPSPEPFENVILLVVDTLRSDRLSLYKETPVQTPRFTKAGADAIVFLNNQAPTPSSPPSHASIQTGMIPRVHGVVGDRGRLHPETPLISSQLGEAGISTAYVGNNSFGMNRLRAAGNWAAFHSPVQEGLGIDCTALVKEVMRVALEKKDAGKRFFISALPWEPHAPYRFHEGITEKYHDGPWSPPVGRFADGHLLVDIMAGRKRMNDQQWSQLEALYNGEVEYMDRCFGTLLDELEEAGLAENTAIVLTSDHGEGLNERGRLGHAYGHYTELADVPFVIFGKGLVPDGQGPRRIATPTSCIDVVPTILAMMGVEASEKVQGENMLPLGLRQGPWVPRVVSAEYGRSYALRTHGWRLIVNYDGSEELYDVFEDPKEMNSVHEGDLLSVRYMRELAGFFLEHRSQWKQSTWGSLANHQQGFIEAIAEP